MKKYTVKNTPLDVQDLIAKNIIHVRKSMGYTQMDLAEKSDVSYGSIKRFERSGKISFESLLKIAEALGRLSDFEKILIPIHANKIIEELFNKKNIDE